MTARERVLRARKALLNGSGELSSPLPLSRVLYLYLMLASHNGSNDVLMLTDGGKG